MVDTVNTHSGDGSGTPAPEGHDSEMIKKVDSKEEELANNGEQSTDTDGENGQGEDEKILGKFDSVDDLKNAYQNLEKKLGSNNDDDAAGSDTNTSEGDDTDTSDDDKGDNDDETDDQDEAKKSAESAGLDMDQLNQTYQEKGELEDSDYEALEKAGIPRETVDSYIAGQEALATQMTQQVHEEVGGEENFNAMIDWASSNMSESEIEEYNSAVDSGDKGRLQSAVRSLAFRYQKANGSDPNLVDGDRGGKVTGDAFQSLAQLTEAMSDPRYEKDPAFRKDVERRLSKSNLM